MTDLASGIALSFRYDGHARLVDNITMHTDTTICGFEMRKSGKFSYSVKRYSVNKIEGDVTIVPRPKRVGPNIGRP